MTRRPSTRCFIFALAFAFGTFAAAPSDAAIFYVGIGTGCTHATVSLAVAAAAANGPGSDTIRIASPSLFLGALVEVNNQSVVLVGGFPNCTTGTPTGRTALNQIGAADAFWVHGGTSAQRTFALYNIDVVMGSTAGRALTLQDMTNVVLDNSTLDDGQAVNGGNVWMQGEVFLQLYNRSWIREGAATAGSGGGVYCELGGSIIVASDSQIRQNVAQVNGGGIFAYDCFVSIQSGGPPMHSVPEDAGVTNNYASDKGGGIYAAGGSTIQLIGTGPGELAYLDFNSSDGLGGGLYLVDSGTTAIARNARIYRNYSDFVGSAVWAGSGTAFTMDVDPMTCSAGRDCSILANNHSFDGGAVRVEGGASATLRQTRIRDNYADDGDPGSGSVADVAGTMLIEGCEIFDNTSVLGVEVSRFYVRSGGALTIALSTIVEPTTIANVFSVLAGSTFRLLSSLVQADHTFAAPAVASQIDCVITRELASFPAGSTLLTTVVDPTFLFENPAAKDFRLKRGSEARDYCDDFYYSPTDDDIDNHPHGHEDLGVPNVIGPFDLGADEWQPDIFTDGFESSTTIRWSSAVS